MHSAHPRSDDDLFELTRDELDALPFGVITLSRSGQILRYNRFEESLARRAAHATVGLDFFTDVAACTNVPAFRGRFDEFARGTDTATEHFTFSFDFRWGRQDVAITLVRKAGHEPINVLVRRIPANGVGHATSLDGGQRSTRAGPPATPNLEQPGRPPYDPRRFEFGAAGRQPTICRLGSAQEALLREHIHRDDVAAVRGVVAAATSKRSPYTTEYRLMQPDNSSVVVLETGLFPAAASEPGYATIVDVGARRENEEALWRAAHHDVLTGLPNQLHLLQRIAEALGELEGTNRCAALLVSNIERFRESNEMFGRTVCNELLKQLGLRLGECVRAGDTVARLGSDWFAVLLTDIADPANISETLAHLRTVLDEPFVIDGRAHHMTLNIGVAIAPDHGRDSVTLLRAAYTAMWAAKLDGQSGVRYYSSEISEQAASNARLRNELQTAVENGELTLHYQPIIDLAGQRVVAVEALVRWNHPTRGLVMPAEFIGLADRSGLIVPLGEWVLREACRQAREWCELGLDLRVSVNVSAVQFRQAEFVPLVAEVLAQSGLAPERLELELTESIMVDGFGAMIERLGRLKAMGLRLALDDFGTGYSSLAYLKHFPLHTLKIDRAFIIDIVTDGFDRAIARAVLTLANELGLDCVVEGVETLEQIDALCALGCTQMQGYFFSRPITAAQLTAGLTATAVPNPFLSGRSVAGL